MIKPLDDKDEFETPSETGIRKIKEAAAYRLEHDALWIEFKKWWNGEKK